MHKTDHPFSLRAVDADGSRIAGTFGGSSLRIALAIGERMVKTGSAASFEVIGA